MPREWSAHDAGVGGSPRKTMVDPVVIFAANL